MGLINTQVETAHVIENFFNLFILLRVWSTLGMFLWECNLKIMDELMIRTKFIKLLSFKLKIIASIGSDKIYPKILKYL